MTEQPAIDANADHRDWRTRTLILVAVGALAAWLDDQLLEVANWSRLGPASVVARSAGATAISVAALAFGFGLERIRIAWTVIFAVALGMVAGLVVYWNSQPDGFFNWSGASLFLAIAIAVPLFQVARDEGRWSFPYTQIHGHAWTNVVLWFACWAFAGVAFLLAQLLAELFNLIGIAWLRHLLNHGWFATALIGAAFGGALGMFRDRERVVRLLQRVVTGVLGVLAPVLGAGLLLFLIALPFTGLHALWDATKATTPILLSCVIGALVLANAVIGHGPEDEATNPVLRWGAMALGLAALPLAIVAAIATGIRINQYGLSPDRLWAVVFVALATAYGLVYLTALVRRRTGWAVLARPANIRLAFATMGIALVLATPIFSFNALSARDQVARLERGAIRADKFDWTALQNQFGQPGLDALETLKHSPNPAIRHDALLAEENSSRSNVAVETRFEMNPVGTALPEPLKEAARGVCGPTSLCRIFLQPDHRTAVVVSDGCADLTPAQQSDPAFKCSRNVERLVIEGSKWQEPESGPYIDPGRGMSDAQERKSLAEESDAFRRGDITVRTVERRQVFVGGKPKGPTFE